MRQADIHERSSTACDLQITDPKRLVSSRQTNSIRRDMLEPRVHAAHPIRLVVVAFAIALTGVAVFGVWQLTTEGWSVSRAVWTTVAGVAALDSWIAAVRRNGAWPIWLHLLSAPFS